MTEDKNMPFVWFLVGFGLFIFTRSVTFIPLAIIIAPLFILRFLRTQRAVKGILLALLGFIVSLTISLWGLYSFEGKLFSLLFNTIRSVLIAVILVLPYVADRLMANRIRGFLSTLVFPISCTMFYFLDSSFGPLDGLGIFYAYTQYGNLPLTQLMSLFGIWGLVFLLSWFASLANWAWDRGFAWDRIKKGVGLFSCIVVLVLLYGGLRVSPFFYPMGSTVRVAAITFLPDSRTGEVGIEKVLRERQYSPFEETVSTIGRLTRQAAGGGAKIVVWQEFAILVVKENEARFLEAAQRLARENAVYLAIGYSVLPQQGKGENRCLLINEKGHIDVNYLKYNLAVGESSFMKKGPGGISVVDSPYGRIGITICRDLEFPAYMRQAGKKGADIVLSPALDFPKGTVPSNTHNQMLRAVENGFSLVRCVNNGLSVAVDYHGRILSSMNYYTTSQEIMCADVPTTGTRTLYTFIGDIFSWLCIVGFLAFIVLAAKGTGPSEKSGVDGRDGENR
jgi:apolipoprotein N-acyltransferase